MLLLIRIQDKDKRVFGGHEKKFDDMDITVDHRPWYISDFSYASKTHTLLTGYRYFR